MRVIDAHQHFWNPNRGDYGWMPEDHAILSRSYSPHDLRPELEAIGIAETILVQAAPTVNETEYLLGIADATSWVAGVVGWIDFEKPSDNSELKRLAAHPKFVGLRPMIQEINDVNWMLRPEFDAVYQAIVAHDLAFDALGLPQHLPNFLTLVQRYPDMRLVVDHGMKPQIGARSEPSFSEWAEGISRLAAAGAYCKLSGLVTEADNWSIPKLQPYVEHILEAFGADRVMWGSDWPVCRLAAEYSDWHRAAGELTAHLSETEIARVFGETAAEFYRV